MDEQHKGAAMAKQKKGQIQERTELTGLERLGLRVSAMINSPSAQLKRSAHIHRLDTDDDQAWGGVMELLGETDGLDMVFGDDGSVTVTWGMGSEEDRVIEPEEIKALEESEEILF